MYTSMAMLSFSRRFELQADQLALTLLTRTGYGKEGLMSFLTKLPELRERSVFSATPPPQARIAALR
jgi:predicted Zn-dependent protease